MSKLSEFLSAHISILKLSQKDVAAAFHTELVRRTGGQGTVKFETVESKLSKLLNGILEGERFFFEKAERLAAFAAAMRLDVEQLNALRATRTLILDPRLPEAAKRYLRDRAAEENARHQCRDVEPARDPAEVRRRLEAEVAADPGALLILADHQFDDYFAGAKVAFTAVEQNPLGYVLVGAPDLVPLPPGPPPAEFDDDGHPMIPHDVYEALVRESIDAKKQYYSGKAPRLSVDDVLEKRLAAVDRLGAKPTFRLDEIGPWLEREAGIPTMLWEGSPVGRRGERVTPSPRELAQHYFDCVVGQPGETTMVWTHRRRVFAVGPARDAVANLVLPHTSQEPDTLSRWKHALDAWNPYLTFEHSGQGTSLQPSSRWTELAEQTIADCGVDLVWVRERWQQHTDPERTLPATCRVRPEDDGKREESFAAVRDLLGREFDLAPQELRFVFTLEQVLSSSVIALPRTPRDLAHLVANMGAGHLLRVRILSYPAEASAPIRAVRWSDAVSHLDGGDVHLILEALRDDVMLEASPLVARPRRERESRIADDDD